MPMSDKEECCYVTFIRLKNIPNIYWMIILDPKKKKYTFFFKCIQKSIRLSMYTKKYTLIGVSSH